MEKGYITAKQAEQVSKYSGYWIRKLCRDGLIDCKKVGIMWLVAEQSLRDYEKTMDELGTDKHKHKS